MPEEILYPVNEEQRECALCGEPLSGIPLPLTSTYPNLVCNQCDLRAVTEPEADPEHSGPPRNISKSEDGNAGTEEASSETGDNPVFIDGHKCWRRYKFGGYITRLDQFDCATLEEFREKHRPE